MPNYSVSERSDNEATGHITTTTSPKTDCAPGCPLKHECYGECSGKGGIFWKRLTEGKEGVPWSDYIAGIEKALEHRRSINEPRGDPTLARGQQYGDQPHVGGRMSGDRCRRYAKAMAKADASWTYCHHVIDATDPEYGKHADHNISVIADMLAEGLTVNVSCETESKVRLALQLGFPAVLVIPSDEEVPSEVAGAPAVWCPKQRTKGVQCIGCGNGKPLCARGDRKFVVVLKAHGSRVRALNERIRRMREESK